MYIHMMMAFTSIHYKIMKKVGRVPNDITGTRRYENV